MVLRFTKAFGTSEEPWLRFHGTPGAPPRVTINGVGGRRRQKGRPTIKDAHQVTRRSVVGIPTRPSRDYPTTKG